MLSTKRNSQIVKKENEIKFKNHNDGKSNLKPINQPDGLISKTEPDSKTTEQSIEINPKPNEKEVIEKGKSKPLPDKVPKPSAPTIVNKTIHIGIKSAAPKPASTKTKTAKEESSETNNKYKITEITWISSTINSASKLSAHAVIGGYDGIGGSPFWVIRYKIGNQNLPGRYDVNKKVAFVSSNGKVVRITENNFDVLCVPPGRVKWVEYTRGILPPEAISAGKSNDGEKLYIGRARKNMTIFPGKVHPIKRTCAICTGEKELEIPTFEILCTKTSES